MSTTKLRLHELLERDADKIAILETEVTKARQNYEQLEKQVEASIGPEVANLKIKSSKNRYRIAALKAKAGQEFGLQEAEQKLDAAVSAYHEAIHYDEFADKIADDMEHFHSADDCWPDSDCRQCSYEPDADEIEEYLLDNAEDFEIEEVTEPPAVAATA